MNIVNIFKIFAFIMIIYSLISFFNTRDYIYRLPSMTQPKYIGLEKLGIRMLSISVVLYAAALFVKNEIISIIASCVIMYLLATLISELSALKEYVYLKKKTK